MRAALAGLALAALVLGCGQQTMVTEESATEAPAAYAVMDDQAQGRASGGEADVGSAPPAPLPAPGQPQPAPANTQTLLLAYAYTTSMELPGDRFVGVMEGHVRACQQAGPAVCQLVQTQRSGDPETQLYGNVVLRAEPAWLTRFRDGLAAEADAAGGKIIEQITSSEDLTRQIVDTEARLRATRTLRDRLQQLLASRPGRLADLIELERELARVQGELDATESNLAVMRARVDMSVLTLNYASAPRPLRADTFRPLGEALAGFLGWIVIGFASIITFIAVIAPWALLIWLIAWGALAIRRRRGGRFINRTPKPAPTPPPAA